ncbi:MAG: DUF4345 family protein, partial [Brevundimonas sp.]
MHWINLAGAGLTLAMGCLGLFFPRLASRLTGLDARTPPSFSEFRATFGGSLVLPALLILFIQTPMAFAFAGLWWAGAALGRVVSIILDRSSTPQNWTAVAFELLFAAT